MTFPKNFTWGAATASYQIEGGAYEDGKGLSVWDRFSNQPEKILGGDSGDVACDHYHRWQEDVGLMAEIGLQAYRFSISWPRLLPEGVGEVSKAGLGFYDQLVDALLKAGVEPWVTLFHWDYPYALFQQGGWLNPSSPDWFADYTRVVVDALSDRVSHWITLNEPQAFIGMGHSMGQHAPGLQLSFSDCLRVTHNVLLAHGKAVQVIRANAKQAPQIGAAPTGSVSVPTSDTPANQALARQTMFTVRERHFFNTPWFCDPMVLGEYPESGLQLWGADMPHIDSRDLETICQPLDFYGVNFYFPEYTVDPDGSIHRGLGDGVPGTRSGGFTGMGWPVDPSVAYYGLKFLYERYKLPVVVTENGMANLDWVQRDGRVHDPQRIDFLHRYLLEARRAIQDGVDLRAYFTWTLMDNYEWSMGYRPRFGLIHVDYATQNRTLKDSAYWYGDVIRSNGASLDN